MMSFKSRMATEVPKTLEARLEIMKAARAFVAQEAGERAHHRRAGFAALRRELELLRDSLPSVTRQAITDISRQCAALLRSSITKYNPDQPRVPAGNRGGGQWTSEGGEGHRMSQLNRA